MKSHGLGCDSSAPVNSATDRDNITVSWKRAIEPCLAVIMPVFNEARTLKAILERVLLQPCVQEIIIVDDASQDGSAGLLANLARQDPRIHLLHHKVNRGKGAAIRTALAHVTAGIVVIQDADLEYDPSSFQRMLEPILCRDTNVVYGSRFAPGTRCSTAAWHRLGNRLLTASTNLLTGHDLTDEATCYKMVRREILEKLELREDGFGFCPELTAKLARLNERIVEVPVDYRARSRVEGKKLRLWHAWEALWCLLRYSTGFPWPLLKAKPRDFPEVVDFSREDMCCSKEPPN